MSIDKATAAKVAKLARIKVEDDALPALAEEFNTILGFIEQLNEVDVEGVKPMTSVTPQRLKRRVDQVTDGDQQALVLSNAPDAREASTRYSQLAYHPTSRNNLPARLRRARHAATAGRERRGRRPVEGAPSGVPDRVRRAGRVRKHAQLARQLGVLALVRPRHARAVGRQLPHRVPLRLQCKVRSSSHR